MKTFSKSAARAVALIAIGALGLAACGSAASPSVGEQQTTAPSVSPRPSASPSTLAASPAASTETFTSERHGFSISYPTGWVARPATEPWTKDVPDFMSKAGDAIYDPIRQGDLWISVASQPIGASSPDQWAAEKLAFDDGCTASEPITVDGATGVIGADDCTRAAVTTDGRGYFVWLYTGGDDPSLNALYDGAWFKTVLATLQLQPKDALD
jgi:hypothetical protein